MRCSTQDDEHRNRNVPWALTLDSTIEAVSRKSAGRSPDRNLMIKLRRITQKIVIRAVP